MSSVNERGALSPYEAVAEHLKREAAQRIGEMELEKALVLLESAAICDPNMAALHNNIGFIKLELGDYASAYTSLLKATRLDPELVQSFKGLITACIRLGRFDEACEHLQRAVLSLGSEETSAMIEMSISIDFGVGKFFDALNKALPIYVETQNADLCRIVIHSLWMLGRAEEAIQIARNHISSHGPTSDIILVMAAIYSDTGNLDAFNQILGDYFQGTMHNAHQYLRAKELVISTEIEAGSYYRAIELCRAYEGHDQDSAGTIRKLMFDCLARTKQYREALRYAGYGKQKKHSARKSLQSLDKPRWNFSSEEDAKVMVYRDQGIGDSVLTYKLIRLYAEILGRNAIFYLDVDVKLLPILPSTSRIIVMSLNETEAFPGVTTHEMQSEEISILLMSWLSSEVPPNKRRRIDKQIANDVIQHVKGQRIASGQFPSCKWNLGCSWRSNHPYASDAKSIKLEVLVRHLRSLNLGNIVSLQYLPTRAERVDAYSCIEIEPCDFFDDLTSLVVAISQCSHILSVSNTTAHIAGLLDKSSTILITKGHSEIWHWSAKNNGGESLIYPDSRIYTRVNKWSSWSGCLQTALAEIITRRQSS